MEGAGQRKLQAGVAKKIKNGARKIVFEKAEEARLAAFSAFKSLGLNIPHLSQAPLSIAGNNIPKRESSLSSGEESISSFAGIAHLKHTSSSEDRIEIAGVSKTVEQKSIENPTVLGSSVIIKTAGTTLVDIHRENPDTLKEGLNTHNHMLNVPTNDICKTNTSSPVQTPCTIEKGPRYAVSIPGGVDSFLDLWDASTDFFFDIHYNKKSELNSNAPFEIHGIAICWESSPVYYLNIPKDLFRDTCQGNNHPAENSVVIQPNVQVELAKKRWVRVGNVLGKKNVRKYTWNLKGQIQVLKLPAVSVNKLGSRQGGIKGLGLDLIDNVYFMFSPICVRNAIDMRIMAWILSPDDEKSSSSNLEKVIFINLSCFKFLSHALDQILLRY